MTEIQFFKDLLNTEIKRITKLYVLWEKISENSENIPDEIHGKILSVIGQTKLLINAKLQQFRELINSCNASQVNQNCKITLDDLRGFWDLIYIQISDINKKFKDLEQLKSSQWKFEEVTSTSPNMPIKNKRQNSSHKIHTEAAKTRLAAVKQKLQAKKSDECCNDGLLFC